MMAGGSEFEKVDWALTRPQDFWYSKQGDTFELNHVNDVEDFLLLRSALNTLSFAEDSQTHLFQALAGLLHLGELQFVADSDGEGSDLADNVKNRAHFTNISRLFRVNEDILLKTLTVRTIAAVGENIQKKLTPIQAFDARDALAKAIYGRMFLWIVDTINLSIQVDPKNVKADIGVLDIFGFECFRHNSFEQLCINYTNETLQQQFNQFVFKMEQIEYQRESIEWSFVEFPDNQDCLDLIEHKLNGILAMVDDECRLPKATDEKLASRMYLAFDKNKRFSASITQKRDSQFCIHHYAGPVVYSTITFVEKNKDQLPKESHVLLQSSASPLLATLFKETQTVPTSGGKPTGPTGNISSVGTQFKEQLAKLMEKIYSTSPHYIRCLKPNDENVPDTFNRVRTTEQLRYGGVLEAVRVARSGFPVRLTHGEFYQKYRPLANPLSPQIHHLPRVLPKTKSDPKALCAQLLLLFFQDAAIISRPNESFGAKQRREEILQWASKLNVTPESIQIGNSKVFLRKKAHDLLEKKRSRRLVSAAKFLQGYFRSIIALKRFRLLQNAVRILQRAIRVYQAYNKVQFLRQQKASIVIQKYWRRYTAFKNFSRFKTSVLWLQTLFRARKATFIVKKLRFESNTVRLQRIVRGLVTMARFNRCRRALVALQCKVRVRSAKRQLRELRVAARDIGALKQSNESLKIEIELLRAKALDDAKKLQEQIRIESEQKMMQLREKEMTDLTLRIQDMNVVLMREREQREKAELNYAEAQRKILKLESTIFNELEPSLETKEVQIAGLSSQLALYEEKVATLEVQLKQTEAAFSHSNEMRSPGTRRTSIIAPHRELVKRPSISSPDLIRSRSISISSEALSQESSPKLDASSRTEVKYDDDHIKNILKQLADERLARKELEEEISRHRAISIDMTAQIESLKKAESLKSQPSHVSPVRRLSKSEITPPKRLDDSKEDVDDIASIVSSSDIRAENALANKNIKPEVTVAISKFGKNIAAIQQKLRLVHMIITFFEHFSY